MEQGSILLLPSNGQSRHELELLSTLPCYFRLLLGKTPYCLGAVCEWSWQMRENMRIIRRTRHEREPREIAVTVPHPRHGR